MNAELAARAKELQDAFPGRTSALIPILHLLEDSYGFIPAQEIPAVADLMGVTPADVEAVLSFYTLFHRAPRGRRLVQVCRGLSCHLCGSDDLAAYLYRELGVARGGTTADGVFTVEEVECLALCKDAPVVQLDLVYQPRVSAQDLASLVRRAREEVAGHA